MSEQPSAARFPTTGGGRILLAGDDGAASYAVIADELALTVGAGKMAAHRLRARYRERLPEEIARTVADPSEIDGEIQALLDVLAD